MKIEAIPSELVTASGSGLDPNISVAAATIQIDRIAKVRSISSDAIQQLIKKPNRTTTCADYSVRKK